MSNLRRAAAVSLVLLNLLASAAAQPRGRTVPRGAGAAKRVSLVLTNGRVFTADEHGTMAQAVAIDGERIVAVGTDEEIRRSYAAGRTIDLRGRLVTPGFNDAHIHFLNGGLAMMRVDFGGATTLAETKRRIAEKARELPEGSWILGRGWDHTLWGGQWPTRRDLDEVAPRHPVFVTRVDGHVSWANSLALERAGITRETRDPDGGELLRDAEGTPTGILKETAANLVGRHVPQPSREEKLRALELALAEARRYGITSVNDAVSGYDALELYRELLAADRLTVRVAEWLSFETPVETLKQQRDEFAALKVDPLRIRITALKGFVDGTLGSRTAAMLAPFADDPNNSGIPRRPPEELNRMAAERAAAGFQLTLHAIGDRANRMALDAFVITHKPPPPDVFGPLLHQPRHRVEHAQVVAPTDFARFRELGVVASMQPSHAISDKRWAQDRLGEYRVLGAYSWHTFRAHGVRVAFGTDWPVEPISPYLGLFAAVTRQSTDMQPAGGWWPQERVGIADAIRCYTAEPAYASFEENDKGQIKPGMLADLVVHTRDLLTISPAEILNTQPAITIFNGRVVYELGAKQ
ncbi:MAG TPA: amidohydrolase [Pyrinomonadaceae bacterium]|nr:amidohydrolase [Pyrinomonadaceae bacterium]